MLFVLFSLGRIILLQTFLFWFFQSRNKQNRTSVKTQQYFMLLYDKGYKYLNSVLRLVFDMKQQDWCFKCMMCSFVVTKLDIIKKKKKKKNNPQPGQVSANFI
eukprot:TRINITY_DN4557_c0_g3_i1.p1 TRINITY_DN4557_c0_g3~~TRINITY_DN4557_c0_g3_i1.p1  ORF type:complete len:103 (+),score=2.26 TRINITY_DN4557_c0_g3_i1:584-892(+)